MREQTGILVPRTVDGSLDDLAERAAFIARQRVRRRPRLRRARRRPLAGLGVGFCLAAVLGGGAVLVRWVLTSPRFGVARVEVRGATRLTEPELLVAAGITPGENLFRVNPKAAAARLEALPGVRRAHLIREFPNRVAVVVEERRPFTLASMGRLHWLDEEGVLLTAEPRPVTPERPLISGLRTEDLGSARAPAADKAMTAIGLLRALLRSRSPLLSQVSEIDASRPDGPVLYTVDGTEIRLGSEQWEDHLGRLEGLLDQISSGRAPAEYVDLRFRDQVIFKPKGR